MAESRKRYSSDLSSEQWRLIKYLIPSAGFGGRPRSHPMREIVNAILYRLKNGCVWEDIQTLMTLRVNPGSSLWPDA